MLLKKPAALLCLLALAAAAQAQTKLTPGLWDHEITMKSGGGQMDAAMARMQEQLANMPPEKRAQMEAMMAQRGISIGAAAGGGPAIKAKVCLTPEQAARDEVPQDQRGQCKQTSRSRSGNTLKFTMECTGQNPGRGEGEFTLISPKETQGKVSITMTGGARTGTVDMDMRARWLAADCGDVKPRP